jgi:formylglycine-generating enzyme required for sulfatase activity
MRKQVPDVACGETASAESEVTEENRPMPWVRRLMRGAQLTVFGLALVVWCSVPSFPQVGVDKEESPSPSTKKTSGRKPSTKKTRGLESGTPKNRRTDGSPSDSNSAKAAAATLPNLQSHNFETVKFRANGTIAEKSPRQAEYFEEDLGGGVRLTMVRIPGNTFQMGTADSMAVQIAAEQQRYCNNDDCRAAVAAEIKAETPQRAVAVPAFFIGRFEVTQAEWRAVAGMKMVKKELPPEPSRFKDPQRPVDSVSWEDAVEFCARLSQKTGRKYRLPTEAEWEYACRSETTTEFAFGDTIFSDFINYDGNHPYGDGAKGVFSASTRPVGWARVFLNGFGLSGMHGNVMEWCQDKWHGSYDGAPADASAWMGNERSASTDRVVRGGSWSDHASRCRSAFRTKLHPRSKPPTVGLRVAMHDA